VPASSLRSNASAGWNKSLASSLTFCCSVRTRRSLIDLVGWMNRFAGTMTHLLKRKGLSCESTEFSGCLLLLVRRWPSLADLRLWPSNIAEPWNSRWLARPMCSACAELRYLTRTGLWPVCRRIRRSSARHAGPYLNRATVPTVRRRMRHSRHDALTGISSINSDGRLRLVVRFQHLPPGLADTFANAGIKGPLADVDPFGGDKLGHA
jgi:hypothetical protein